ncbi:E3 ubiquitin-protein ligase Topors-like [Grus japonensis]|uniref:E3 ubiquitin-protein ligase Topors-like n=1 Tax=Grus japonensis TaxID=30415 RepID=A0ABC9Y503_GRUJA
MAVLQAQEMAGLPTIPLHGNINKLVHKCHHAALEGGPQQLDQKIFSHPKRTRRDMTRPSTVAARKCQFSKISPSSCRTQA